MIKRLFYETIASLAYVCICGRESKWAESLMRRAQKMEQREGFPKQEKYWENYPPRKFAGGGKAIRGLGKAFMKGGKV